MPVALINGVKGSPVLYRYGHGPFGSPLLVAYVDGTYGVSQPMGRLRRRQLVKLMRWEMKSMALSIQIDLGYEVEI